MVAYVLRIVVELMCYMKDNALLNACVLPYMSQCVVLTVRHTKMTVELHVGMKTNTMLTIKIVYLNRSLYMIVTSP